MAHNHRLKGERMKKTTVTLLGLVLISTMAIAMTSPAKADVNLLSWRPIYVSQDSGTVIYEDGATASYIVGLTNNIAPGFVMNVSKIILEFYQIGENKTLDLSAAPHQLQYNQQGVFTVSFTADSSEFFTGQEFDYNLIVEWVNATAGPTEVVGYWDLPRWWTGAPAFEVYNAAQVDAQDSLAKYYTYYDNYGTFYWDSVLGGQKANQAILEKDTGDVYSSRGDYASALTHYNSANTLWEDALAAEFAWRTKWEDAELNVTLTESAAAMITAESFKTQADAAVTNAYGWYFIGLGFAIGWTLMGIGAIVWAWRRPTRPPA